MKTCKKCKKKIEIIGVNTLKCGCTAWTIGVPWPEQWKDDEAEKTDE